MEAIEQAQSLFARLAAQARETSRTPEPDLVHDLRVAIRRLMQLLEVHRKLFRKREARKFRRRIKDLLGLAGVVRDCDIAAKLLSRRAADAGALQSRVKRRRLGAVRALRDGLRAWLARRETLPLKSRPVTPRADQEAEQLRSATKEFFAAGNRAASGTPRGRDLHRFRVSAKHFRYTMELYEPVYGAALAPLLEDLRSVQTALGDVNDCRATRSLLKKLDANEALLASLSKRQRAKTGEFVALWAERFAARGRRRAWLKVIAAVPSGSGLPQQAPAPRVSSIERPASRTLKPGAPTAG